VIRQLLDDPRWPLVEDTATVGVGVAFLVVGLLHLVPHVAAQAASAEIIIGGVLIGLAVPCARQRAVNKALRPKAEVSLKEFLAGAAWLIGSGFAAAISGMCLLIMIVDFAR